MPKITNLLLVSIKNRLGQASEIPAWMGLLLQQPLESIQTSSDVEIHVERKFIEQSYIDFLKEQIRLAARGPEWSEVLNGRLRALEPHVGEEITTVTFLHGSEGFVVRMLESSQVQILHCEVQ